MKYVSLIFSLFLFSSINAQIKTPAASPYSKITQTVGLVDVTVEYSRPSVKGRTIFAADGLVPFNQIWRTGANSATKLTCNNAIMVGGKKLEKGSYAILSKPGKMNWEFYLYPYEKGSWSSYKEQSPLVTVSAKPMATANTTESFTISFDDLRDASSRLSFSWDKTSVGFDITVQTDEDVMANIAKVLAGPSKGDYYNAASYYFSSGKDLKTAYEYVKKATDGDDQKYWQMRRKSQIEAGLGKYKDAVKTAKISMELAEKAGNMQYVKFNKDAIAEWSKK